MPRFTPFSVTPPLFGVNGLTLLHALNVGIPSPPIGVLLPEGYVDPHRCREARCAFWYNIFSGGACLSRVLRNTAMPMLMSQSFKSVLMLAWCQRCSYSLLGSPVGLSLLLACVVCEGYPRGAEGPHGVQQHAGKGGDRPPGREAQGVPVHAVSEGACGVLRFFFFLLCFRCCFVCVCVLCDFVAFCGCLREDG